MKLYTYCNEKDYDIKCQNNDTIKLVDYSLEDYNRFINKIKSHYIYKYHSWYDTDMSDSDSGSSAESFPINQTNMVIKNNELFGVLVKTSNTFPKYYIYDLNEESFDIDLGGGYEKNYFEWTKKDNELSNLEILEVSLQYLIIKENYSKSIKNDKEKLTSYMREVIGFLQADCIVENDKVIGFKYDKHTFILDNPESLCIKIIKEENSISETIRKTEIFTLVKITKEFLEQNVFDVTYEDYYYNRYEIYTKI